MNSTMNKTDDEVWEETFEQVFDYLYVEDEAPVDLENFKWDNYDCSAM